MTSLCFDQHPVFQKWLCEKLKAARLEQPAVTIAVLDDKKIKAVVAYTGYNGHDCHMAVAGEGKWLNKELLKVFFKYPFIQGGCRRVTVFCKDSNLVAQRFAKRLGFVEEGILRHYFEDGANCHVLGLLREDCKYLGDENGE